jgi:hypothetical protein
MALNTVMLNVYAECRYAEWRYAECRGAIIYRDHTYGDVVQKYYLCQATQGRSSKEGKIASRYRQQTSPMLTSL